MRSERSASRRMRSAPSSASSASTRYRRRRPNNCSRPISTPSENSSPTSMVGTRRIATAGLKACATYRHAALKVCAAVLLLASAAFAADPLPAITQPVNDFAKVIDASSAAELERMIRTLQAATGDVVVVVTVPTVEPYADVREYAVKLFENQGRGIGEKGKDNGLLILLALKERRVWVEVGYGLEQWITDGFSGETSREVMAPEFRNGRYGAGLVAGAQRIIGRIAQGRNVSLDGVPVPRPLRREPQGTPIPLWAIILFFIFIL